MNNNSNKPLKLKAKTTANNSKRRFKKVVLEGENDEPHQ